MVKTKTQFTINVATQVKEALESMLPCNSMCGDYKLLLDEIELYTHVYEETYRSVTQDVYFCKHNLLSITKRGQKIFRFGAINFADKKDKERIIEAFISLLHVYGYGTKLENSIIFS